MAPLPASEKPDEKGIPGSGDSIKRLYVQIRKMPELTEQARVIDQVLLNRMKDLKSTASIIIDQFNEQKKLILQRFDNWILPIAQDVLDHEPFEALFAPWEDPLYFYQKIIVQSSQWLHPGGYLFLELPHQRASQIVSLCPVSKWKVELIFDLSQRERILVARWLEK